jgi:DNA-binding NarL/FixJ family response regulator
VLHPAIASKVLRRFALTSGTPSDTRTTTGLTGREVEFLKLMTRGLSNKEIACEVDLSIRTVQGSLVQLFKKLGVGSRTEAVIYALKNGLATLEDVDPGKPIEVPTQ